MALSPELPQTDSKKLGFGIANCLLSVCGSSGDKEFSTKLTMMTMV